jgi:hypothetical protein
LRCSGISQRFATTAVAGHSRDFFVSGVGPAPLFAKAHGRVLTGCRNTSNILLEGPARMRTFEIAEISEMSRLSIPQIEQAISRERLPVQGEGRRGRPRQFSAADAFTFCVIGEMRRLGIDWKRIIGSTAFPWPIADEIDKMEFLLLTPMLDNHRTASEPKKLDINPVTPQEMAVDFRAFKAGAGVLIDARAIAKRIETFARRR